MTLLTSAAMAFAFAPSARASINVVPNPGFEQGGCGNAPVVCGWELVGSDPHAFMIVDSPRSGSAAMGLGWSGEIGGEFWNWYGADAETTPALCASIGAGVHPASFWFDAASDESVSLAATFYQATDCTGATSNDFLGESSSGAGWQQLTGALLAPAGTQSALFSVAVSGWCANYSGCDVYARFDDLDVEDTVVPSPGVSSFSPASGPIGTSVDVRGANFTGATTVEFNGTQASFTVDSDSELHATVPSGATDGPITVTTPAGSGTSHSSFTVSPSITSFSPTSGLVGTMVDIRGANFTGATGVKFTGSWAYYFRVDSDTEIHAAVPSGATTGPISITTADGTATSSSSFNVDTPSFTFTCTALTCSFAASPSTDPGGTNRSYSWSFGDGTPGSGQTVNHTYGRAAAYTVTLTVTDNAGGGASASQNLTLIALSARGYKVKGTEKVDLSWSGPIGATFELDRNGTQITTTQKTAYTDTLDTKSSATDTYQVCARAASICSNQATVHF
jgi:hypothetical protein